MIYYKNKEGEIFTLDESSMEHLLPPGCVRMTYSEVMELAPDASHRWVSDPSPDPEKA